MNKNLLIYGSVVLGIILLVIAGIYWFTVAGSLPTYFPGFQTGSSAIHIKHGIGAFILALALFAFAWFSSGKKTVV